jgi:preprotein translocase subunit SecE
VTCVTAKTERITDVADVKKKKPADKKAAEDTTPAAPATRASLIQFFREVRRETSKVTWPTFRETYLTTIMVFVMVGMTMVFFFAVDWVLAFGERFLIGAAG